jgi:hypothetical protein
MATQQAMDGTSIRRLGGKLFLTNFGGEDFVFVYEFPEGTGLTKGQFTIDATTEPAQITLSFTDGIGKNGDRLRDKEGGVVVTGIVRRDRNMLAFFAPPPGKAGWPTVFPNVDEGLVGENLCLVFRPAD